MPTYTITAPNGKKLSITGDQAPSESDLDEIFKTAGVGGQKPPSAPRAPGLATIGDQVKSKRSSLATAAPAVGGLIGGFVGGIPGAAVGGAAGQGVGTLIDHASEIPGAVVDVARNALTQPKATMQGFAEGTTQGAIDMGKEGAVQGATQFAGGKIAQAGGVMAKWLMNRATSRVSAKLMQEFPDLADTLLDNALTVSKGGYGKAKSLLVMAKKKATDALGAADKAGATVPIQMTDDIAESLKTALLEDAIKGKGIPAATGAITAASSRLPPQLKAFFGQIEQAVASGVPLDLKPSYADILKRRLQQESKALYAQRGAPNGPKAMGMDATERAELAAQINTAIDALASGYKAANAVARPLIGAVRGIQQAIRPNGNLYQAMVRPAVGAVMGEGAGQMQGLPAGTGAVAGALMTSPAGMSREAILLKDPRIQQMLKQMPRASVLALMEMLNERSAEPTASSAPQGGPGR